MVDTSTEAVTKLLDGVTPGPWEAGDHGRVEAVKNTVADLRYKNGRTDGMFIAASRDLVPALLAERDALWDEVDRINAQPLTVQDAAKVPEVRALIEAVDYIVDGMGIDYPDYQLDPDEDYLDAANAEWVKDTLNRLATALRAITESKA